MLDRYINYNKLNAHAYTLLCNIIRELVIIYADIDINELIALPHIRTSCMFILCSTRINMHAISNIYDLKYIYIDASVPIIIKFKK
jgi:hypothetical protein